MEGIRTWLLRALLITLSLWTSCSVAHVKMDVNVNRILSFTADGHQKNTLFLDNAFAPSSVDFVAHHHIHKCAVLGGELDILVDPNNSRFVSQIKTSDLLTDISYIGKADLWFSYGMLGKLSIGYGEAASYGIASMSFAGTGDTISSSQVSNLAGGMRFHTESLLTPARQNDFPPVSPYVGLAFNSLDGVGSIYDVTGYYRSKNRIRYDSMEWNGFMVSVSHGTIQPFYHNARGNDLIANTNNTKVFTDVALRFATEFNVFKLAAGIGYAHWSLGFYNNENTAANNAGVFQGGGADVWTLAQIASRGNRLWSGSVAAEHTPTGLNIAGSYGRLRKMSELLNDTKSWYVQIGKRNSLIQYGETNIVIDNISEIKIKDLYNINIKTTINNVDYLSYISDSYSYLRITDLNSVVSATRLVAFASVRLKASDRTPLPVSLPHCCCIWSTGA